MKFNVKNNLDSMYTMSLVLQKYNSWARRNMFFSLQPITEGWGGGRYRNCMYTRRVFKVRSFLNKKIRLLRFEPHRYSVFVKTC